MHDTIRLSRRKISRFIAMVSMSGEGRAKSTTPQRLANATGRSGNRVGMFHVPNEKRVAEAKLRVSLRRSDDHRGCRAAEADRKNGGSSADRGTRCVNPVSGRRPLCNGQSEKNSSKHQPTNMTSQPLLASRVLTRWLPRGTKPHFHLACLACPPENICARQIRGILEREV